MLGRLTKSAVDSDAELRRMSADRANLHRQELDVVQKRLNEALRANVEMGNKLQVVKTKLETSNNDNGALRKRIEADTLSHENERAGFARRMSDVEGKLTLENEKSFALATALKAQEYIN